MNFGRKVAESPRVARLGVFPTPDLHNETMSGALTCWNKRNQLVLVVVCDDHWFLQ